jgi:hypothetical protein
LDNAYTKTPRPFLLAADDDEGQQWQQWQQTTRRDGGGTADDDNTLGMLYFSFHSLLVFELTK